MSKYLMSLCLPMLLVGCATGDMQMQMNTNTQLVEKLAQRVAALEAQQHQLKQTVATSAVKTPSGVVAIASERKTLDGGEPAMGQDHDLALGIEQFRAGDIDGAIGTLTQVAQTGATETAVVARYWLGNAFYTRRDFANANRFLGQYLQADPMGEFAERALPMLIQSLRASGREQDADVLQRDGVNAISRRRRIG